jgi:hypothetical protein
MQRKRFQIKLSAILWATFWIGVCLASFSIDYQGDLPIRLLIFAARVFSPFVAIGALFDQPWAELAVGIGLAGAYIAVWSAAVRDGLTGFP